MKEKKKICENCRQWRIAETPKYTFPYCQLGEDAIYGGTCRYYVEKQKQ